MSNATRCHDCNHRPGARQTRNMAAADNGRVNKLGAHLAKHDAQPKKAPCSCDCHYGGKNDA